MKKKIFSPDLGRILNYIGRRKYLVILTLICTIGTVFIDLVYAEIIRKIITATQKTDISSIKELVAFAAVLLPINIMFTYLGIVSTSKFSNSILHDIKNDSVKHVSQLPVSYLDHNRTGEILSKLSNDVNRIQTFLKQGINYTLVIPFMIIFYMIYMFYISPLLFLVSFISFPILIPISYKLSTKFKLSSKKYMEYMGKMNNSINDMIGGISIVKSFCLETFLSRNYEIKLKQATNQARITDKNLFGGRLAFEIAEKISIVSCLIFGTYMCLNNTFELGALVAFFTILGMSLNPIMDVSLMYFNSKSAMAAAERVFSVLDYPVEKNGYYKKGNFNPDKTPIIEFNNVCFEYNKNVPVITDLSFKVFKGQTVAIVGPSGGGKTSILNMICGFYKSQQGSISFMGKDINEWDNTSMRDNISYVSQTAYLFPITIAQNIALGREGCSQEEIVSAAKFAYADDFINESQNGYDTIVEERGGNFSGGQNQRISIARAFLKDSQVLLLDEATASLDRQSELQIQEAIENLSKNKTVVVVAHRISTIQNADVILVLDKGRIQEKGTHSELLNKNGVYTKLYSANLNQEEVVE